MAKSLLALGSNLDSPLAYIRQAIHHISRLPSQQILARSSFHRTDPIGGPADQGAFLNGCLLLETSLSPEELSDKIHEIEKEMGRERRQRWAARNIDIDLLLFDRQTFHSPKLIVPHPRMSFRRFVLEPACEIAADWIHPCCGWTLARLLSQLQQRRPLVAVVTTEPTDAQRLSSAIGEHFRCTLLEGDQGPLDLSAPGDLQPIQFAAGGRFPARRGLEVASDVLVGSFCQESFSRLQTTPALVVVWNSTTESEATIRGRIQWRGPLAFIAGTDFDKTSSEAIAAVSAAWPELQSTSKS